MNLNYKKVINYLINCFLPSRCPYCDNVITPYVSACSKCKTKIEEVNIVNNLEKSKCISPFLYEGIYKKAILNLKFGNCPNYSQPMSIDICQSICKKLDVVDFDYITCVPQSKKSYIERGYNQAELLARQISVNFNIKFLNLIVKIRNTDIQHKIDNASKRKLNVKDAFSLNTKYNIEGKKILLVDDIMTTGATLNECCKVLYSFGAYEVVCTSYAFTSL